jgi:hypothetical protein
LLHRTSPAERERGLAVLGQFRDMCQHGRFYSAVPSLDLYTARERARRGDRDAALPELREAVDSLFLSGQLDFYIVAIGVLVETLLDRSADGNVTEADAAIERLAAAPADDGLVIREVWLFRLRALLAQARGDEATYRDYRDRYRAMATSLGFEGHMKWAEAMA